MANVSTRRTISNRFDMVAAIPNSLNSDAVREILRARISVDRPGPPFVITKITSSTLNASINLSRHVTINTGSIKGILI